jgi:hypothetical protein
VNLTISNVPGSPNKLGCYAAPLVAHYPLSLVFDGFTLNITASATSKDLTSESSVMPKHCLTHGT